MGKFTNFKIIAEREDGSYTKFEVREGDNTPRPDIGFTHDDAFNAETDLYNSLVRKFQGENA